MNVAQDSLETEILIAIFRQLGDKWQSKTLFLAIFDPHPSIVKSVFDCRLTGVITTDKTCANKIVPNQTAQELFVF